MSKRSRESSQPPCEKHWNDLTNEQRLKAKSLGFTSARWVNDDWSSTPTWTCLAKINGGHEAATALGFNALNWRGKLKNYETHISHSSVTSGGSNSNQPFQQFFGELSSEQQLMAESLGFSKKAWNRASRGEALEWGGKPTWAELATIAGGREAATSLGFNESTWHGTSGGSGASSSATLLRFAPPAPLRAAAPAPHPDRGVLSEEDRMPRSMSSGLAAPMDNWLVRSAD